MHGEGSIGYFPTEAAAERVSLSEQELKKPFYLPGVPYAHHVRRIALPSSSPTSAFDKPQEVMSYLAQVYMSLLDAMIDNLRSLAEAQHPSGQEEQKQHIPTKVGKGLSYNLLMTKKHMHMIPRREATYRLPEPKDPKGLGATTTEPAIVGCNALAYTVG
jgi:ATP adenylyltransferase